MEIKIKRISDFSFHKMPPDAFPAYITEAPIMEKDAILAYLKQFDDCAFTSQPVYDIYTGEKVGDSDNAKTDGIYTWYASEVYHFKKYDLRLNDDFIQHVKSRLA